MNYTRGEWYADGTTIRSLIDHGEVVTLASIYPGERESEAKANSVLMASAPDLLSALKSCLQRLQVLANNMTPHDKDVIQEATAVMKKATSQMLPVRPTNDK